MEQSPHDMFGFPTRHLLATPLYMLSQTMDGNRDRSQPDGNSKSQRQTAAELSQPDSSLQDANPDSADAIAERFLGRERLEEIRRKSLSILWSTEASIGQFEEALERGSTSVERPDACNDVYQAEIADLQKQRDERLLVIASVDAQLSTLDSETRLTEADYGDEDRQERIEEYTEVIRGLKVRIKKDVALVAQLEKEIQRLESEFGK